MNRSTSRSVSIFVVCALLVDSNLSAALLAPVAGRTHLGPVSPLFFSSQAMSNRYLQLHQQIIGTSPKATVMRQEADSGARHMSHLPTDLIRRRFLAVAGAAAAAIPSFAQISTQATKQPKKARAVSGAVTDFWNFYPNPIAFVKFSPNALKDSSLLQVVEILGVYAVRLQPFVAAWQSGNATEALDAQLRTEQEKTWQALTAVGGVQNHLEKALNAPLPTHFETLWSRVLYQALPQYLGQRGILLEVSLSPLLTHVPGALENLALSEGIALYAIEDVHPSQVETWNGKADERLEVSITHPMSKDNVVFATTPRANNAFVRYGAIILNHELRQNDVQLFRRVFLTQIRTAERVRHQEWETTFKPSAPQNDDAFTFSKEKLIGRFTDHPPTDLEIDSLFIQSNRGHENEHWRSAAERLYPRGRTPTLWPFYDRFVNRIYVLSELRGTLAGLRFSEPKARHLELMRLLGVLSSDRVRRPQRLVAYNLFDLLLEELSAHPDRYGPEIQLQASRFSARFQIAGQLYRLSEEHLAQALDAAFAALKKTPSRLLLPEVIDPIHLYHMGADKPQAPSSPNGRRAFIKRSMGIAASIVAVFLMSRQGSADSHLATFVAKATGRVRLLNSVPVVRMRHRVPSRWRGGMIVSPQSVLSSSA